MHLFIFIIDDLRFLMPLEPHHVLRVEPPALLLESFCCQVLRLRSLHVVEDEEQRLCAQPLEEVYRVASRRRCLNENVQIIYLGWCVYIPGGSRVVCGRGCVAGMA